MSGGFSLRNVNFFNEISSFKKSTMMENGHDLIRNGPYLFLNYDF